MNILSIFTFILSWLAKVCVRGKTWYYIDGATDPNNWMYHVQYARNTEEQNMEAYQFYGDIFFRTTKLIKMGTELRVFYGQDYCKHVGFKESLNNLLYFKGRLLDER